MRMGSMRIDTSTSGWDSWCSLNANTLGKSTSPSCGQISEQLRTVRFVTEIYPGLMIIRPVRCHPLQLIRCNPVKSVLRDLKQ